MEKILVTIDNCRYCSYSILFMSKEANFSILACNKTKRVLKVVCDDEYYDCDIPDDCPLPSTVSPKTD